MGALASNTIDSVTGLIESIRDHRIITISAGPGSGKTTLIADMIAGLYKTEGYRSKDIICLSFSNAACNELFRNVKKHNAKIGRGRFRTFHSYAARLLDESGEKEDEIIEIAQDCLKNKIEDIKTDVMNVKIIFLDEAQDMKECMYELIRGLIIANRNVFGETIKVVGVSDVDQAVYQWNDADPGLVMKLPKIDENGVEQAVIQEDSIHYVLKTNYRSLPEIVEYTEDYRDRYYTDIYQSIPEQLQRGLCDPGSRMNAAPDKESGKAQIKRIKISRDDYLAGIAKQIYRDVLEIPRTENVQIGVFFYTHDEVSAVYKRLNMLFGRDENVSICQNGDNDKENKHGNWFSIKKLVEFDSLLRRMHECKDDDGYISEDDMDTIIKDFSNAYQNSIYLTGVLSLIEECRCAGDSINYDGFTGMLEEMRFDEFVDFYGIELPGYKHDEKAHIHIMVSTLHSAKGTQYDHVYMAIFRKKNKNDVDFIYNGTETLKDYDYIRMRYVAMTRAKEKLYIFNDIAEEKYTSEFDEDMTDIRESDRYENETASDQDSDHGYEKILYYTPENLISSYDCNNYYVTAYSSHVFLYDELYDDYGSLKPGNGLTHFFEDTPEPMQATSGENAWSYELDDYRKKNYGAPKTDLFFLCNGQKIERQAIGDEKVLIDTEKLESGKIEIKSIEIYAVVKYDCVVYDEYVIIDPDPDPDDKSYAKRLAGKRADGISITDEINDDGVLLKKKAVRKLFLPKVTVMIH